VTKREKPFNNPFSGIRLNKPPERKMENSRDLERPAPIVEPEDEASLFRAVVGEVQPIRGSPRLPGVKPPVEVESLRIVDDEADAFAELCELVAQKGPLDLADSDERIEGAAPGLDIRILRRLRAAHYAIEAHLDLHGLTREEAKKELAKFMEESRRRARRLVLIVHGRGLHSKDQIPVLKAGLQIWLSRGRIGRHVLAFTSAQRHDGGAGAVYVLLRR
jgi:DNA-nicking Smr family endonuclease